MEYMYMYIILTEIIILWWIMLKWVCIFSNFRVVSLPCTSLLTMETQMLDPCWFKEEQTSTSKPRYVTQDSKNSLKYYCTCTKMMKVEFKINAFIKKIGKWLFIYFVLEQHHPTSCSLKMGKTNHGNTFTGQQSHRWWEN